MRRQQPITASRNPPCTHLIHRIKLHNSDTICVQNTTLNGVMLPSNNVSANMCELRLICGLNMVVYCTVDGCTRRGIFASTSWTVACEGPGTKHTSPRLVVTHRLAWVHWSRGCKTPPSYRLEGPALSRLSPVGLRSPHARHEGLKSGHQFDGLKEPERWSGQC